MHIFTNPYACLLFRAHVCIFIRAYSLDGWVTGGGQGKKDALLLPKPHMGKNTAPRPDQSMDDLSPMNIKFLWEIIR